MSGEYNRYEKVASKKAKPRGASWGRGLWDAPPPETKAAEEDRKTREKYGVKLRSPYLTITQIPEVVGPGDYAEARAILGRVMRALEHGEGGLWTPSERNRLRGQQKAWARRASGKDVLFNLVGWRKHAHHAGRDWDRWEHARKFAGIVEELAAVVEAASPESLYEEITKQMRARKGTGK